VDEAIHTVAGAMAMAGGYDALKALVLRTISKGPSAVAAVRQIVKRDTGADLDDDRLRSALAEPEVLDALLGEAPNHHQWAALLRGVAQRGSGGSARGEDVAASIAAALVLLVEQEFIEPDRVGGPVASVAFDPHMRTRLEELQRTVEYLTDDQYRIVAQQRHRKVRISGVAGSGKTLVAMEKARRLDAADFRTLLLCHNPALASHMADVLSDSGVDVMSFCAWIDMVNGDSSAAAEGSPWTPLDEPTSEQLVRAFDRLLAVGTDYQAVIVDEGQDFRDEWWTVVEAAIEGSDLSALYIFHDDMQALVPHRSNYPATDATFSLTRNCRNAGQVYEAMRRLMAGIPRPDPLLEGSGVARLLAFRREDVGAAVRSALLEMADVADATTVVVTSGSYRRNDLDPDEQGIIIDDLRWQWSIRRSFGRIARADSLGFGVPLATEVGEILAHLSEAPWPTPEDAAVIRRAAKLIVLRASDQHHRNEVVHAVEDAAAAAVSARPVSRRATWQPRPTVGIDLLGSDGWLEEVPVPRTLRLTDPHDVTVEDGIPVFTVAQFKGLEADNVVAIWDGASAEPLAELFVAVSRARLHLACLISADSMPVLPPRFRGDIDRNQFSELAALVSAS
jgi:hypothetical protein